MKPTILLQLDTGPHPSSFDAVVAIDAGVDHLLPHGSVSPDNVRELVHGAIFTRGLADLHHTAIFVGGTNVFAAERLVTAIRASFFGPFRVSVLMDANGSNTTAAAAVLMAGSNLEGGLRGRRVAVLGGTGPVGLRVARLCLREGAEVSISARTVSQAQEAAAIAAAIFAATSGPVPRAFSNEVPSDLSKGLGDVDVVINAAAAGIAILPESIRSSLPNLKLAIDLNAVPPMGIEGIDPTDKGADRSGVKCWGALAVGGTKMKIHTKAIQRLFESNDLILDAEECLEIGKGLMG